MIPAECFEVAVYVPSRPGPDGVLAWGRRRKPYGPTGRDQPTPNGTRGCRGIGYHEEAVRMRVKRGTLRSERRGGRVFVSLGPSQPDDRPDEPTALISAKDELIATLRE